LSEIAKLMEPRFDHVGRLTATPAWHLAAHTHPVHQLICVLRGRMAVRLQGREYAARAGEFLLYPAGEAHEEWAETAALETLYIGFAWDALPSAATRQGLDARGRLRPLLEWLLEDRHARQPADAARRNSPPS
jgi:uncharacterized protein YjlB